MKMRERGFFLGMKSFAAAAALCAVCTAAGGAAYAAGFADMPDDWSRESLEWAAEAGIITGDDNGYIYPGKVLTRAEIAAMLSRTFGFEGSGTGGFSDVGESDWFAPYVSAASEHGFMTGSGGMFRPYDTVTREEAVTAIARAFSVAPGEGGLEEYADVDDAADWAKGYFAAFTERGVISGDGGMLRPREGITKKEAAAVIERCAKLPDLPVRESDGSLWTPVY